MKYQNSKMIFDWSISTPISLTQQDSWHRDQCKGQSPEQIGWREITDKIKKHPAWGNVRSYFQPIKMSAKELLSYWSKYIQLSGQRWMKSYTQLLDKTYKQYVFSSIHNKLEDKLRLSDMSLTVVHAIHFRTICQLLSTGHLHKLLWCFRYW